MSISDVFPQRYRKLPEEDKNRVGKRASCSSKTNRETPQVILGIPNSTAMLKLSSRHIVSNGITIHPNVGMI